MKPDAQPFAVPETGDPWLSQLRASGCRLTGPRRAVVEVIRESNRALTARDVLAQAQMHCPKLGAATVYRTLETLEALGLVQRVHDRYGCHQYVAAGEAPQSLVYCQRCGQMLVMDGDLFDWLREVIAARCAFEVREVLLQFSGVCASCR